MPQVDVDSWRLDVSGMVDEPFSIDYAELLSLDSVEETVTLQCVSNEIGGSLVGNAVWQGVPLTVLLERAGVQPGATQIVGRSIDRWTAGFPTEIATDGRVALVAYAMNGEPLPVTHGFPARLIVAGLYGYVSATKWLSEIELTTWDGFDGYWISRGWAKEGPIKTASRIDVPRTSATVAAGPDAGGGSGVGAHPRHRAGRGAGRRRRLAGVPARRRGERQHVGAVAVRVGRPARRPRADGPGHRRRRRHPDQRHRASDPRRRDWMALPARPVSKGRPSGHDGRFAGRIQKGSSMDRTSRTIPALVLGAGLTLGAGLAFTSCGDDDDDENVPATEPGGTEPMVDTTELMTDTTEAMIDTTGG